MDNPDADLQAPRRRVWVAVLLAALFGPVAQVYCGRFKRAVGLYAINWLIAFLAILALLYLPSGRLGLVVGAALIAGVYLFVLIDAIRLARSDSAAPLRRYQRWWVYVAIIIACGAVSEVVSRMNVRYWSEAFILTGGSMRNTLLAGDRFIVDKLPLLWRSPRRGEIVAYRSPGNRDEIFSHRIVALPGDEIEIRDEQVILNDQPLTEEYAIFEGKLAPYEALSNLAPQSVPPGHVFILGDNRRAAKDSRFEGFVPLDDVVGVARTIFWSREHSISPPCKPSESREPVESWGPIRWDRIGQRLVAN
jgi:signal peptidase I